MSREWKPGDVAVATVHGKPNIRVMATSGVEWVTHQGFAISDRDGDTVGNVADIRPLVVIDPEDREQVERLATLLAKSGSHRGRVAKSAETNGIQRALREFADPKPPMPEEPPAWSVVVVAESTPFTRTHRDHITPPYQACWFGEHPRTGERVRLTWGELHALGDVRLVGKGVS